MAADGQEFPDLPPAGTSTGQPGATGATEEEHWNYTLRKLGSGVIDIELTDEHRKDCLDDTKRWFAERVGCIHYVQLPLVAGQSNYYLSSDVIEVHDVWLPNHQAALMIDPDTGFSYMSLFGSWGASNGSPMPYSDLVQRLQYMETIGRVFSQDRDWDWQPELRRLVISPPPRSGGMGVIAANAILKVGSSAVDTRRLDPRHHDFFRRKLMIEAMRTLGTIRDTYDAYPTMGGDRTMNGGALIQRADQLEQKLEQDVIAWERACPIISG